MALSRGHGTGSSGFFCGIPCSVENAVSSLFSEFPEGLVWLCSEFMRDVGHGSGSKCGPWALWKFLYPALPVFCLSSQRVGKVKVLQRLPLKAILRRSSVFPGADFSVGLVSRLPGKNGRV